MMKTSLPGRFLLLILCLLLMLPQASFAAKDALPAQIRVLLQRLNLTDQAWMTLEGRYLARCADGTEVLLPADSRITVFVREGQLVLFHEGLALSAGKKLTLSRRQEGSTEPGIRFNLQQGLYPGDLTLSVKDGVLQPVLSLPVETYLLGVVPYEMNDAFPAEALKAQAVCARTYALSKINASAEWDVVDTTNDQVFKGIPEKIENTARAVSETEGLVLTSGDRLITAWYGASNGGQTELPANVWNGNNIPKCFAMTDDPWDIENPDSLRRTAVLKKDGSSLSPGMLRLIRTALEKEPEMEDFSLSAEDPFRVDAIRSVRLAAPRFAEPSRLMTKLVMTVKVSAALKPGHAISAGDEDELDIEDVLYPESAAAPAATPVPEDPSAPVPAGSFTITLDLFPDAVFMMGLSISGQNNEIITVTESEDSFTLTSGRFGHGVGMSQRGAEYQAKKDHRTFEEILDFYYPGAKLKRYEGEAAPLPTPDPALAETPGPLPTATPRPTLMPVTEPLPEGAWLASVEHIDDDSSLNLRELPSPGAVILMRLYKHQKLIVLEEAEVTGWVRVKTDAVEGYVMNSFLQAE